MADGSVFWRRSALDAAERPGAQRRSCDEGEKAYDRRQGLVRLAQRATGRQAAGDHPPRGGGGLADRLVPDDAGRSRHTGLETRPLLRTLEIIWRGMPPASISATGRCEASATSLANTGLSSTPCSFSWRFRTAGSGPNASGRDRQGSVAIRRLAERDDAEEPKPPDAQCAAVSVIPGHIRADRIFGDKRKIVTSLKDRLSEPIADTGGRLPNDRAIHEIRKVLEREHGTFDFYDPLIRELWPHRPNPPDESRRP